MMRGKKTRQMRTTCQMKTTSGTMMTTTMRGGALTPTGPSKRASTRKISTPLLTRVSLLPFYSMGIDEDVQGLLTELNDTAIQALLRSDDPANTTSNNNEHALECLKRGEQLLEAVTAEGKDVDRNLIVVVLYNLGCTYQR